MRALGRHVRVLLAIATLAAVGSSESALAVAGILVHISRIVRALVVGVVVRVLAAMRLLLLRVRLRLAGAGPSLLLSLSGRVGSSIAAVLRVGSRARAVSRGSALGVLAEVISLRAAISTVCALLLRNTLLLSLAALLLAIILAMVIVVVGAAVLGISGVIGRVIARGRAESTTGLLLALGLRLRLLLVLEAVVLRLSR